MVLQQFLRFVAHQVSNALRRRPGGVVIVYPAGIAFDRAALGHARGVAVERGKNALHIRYHQTVHDALRLVEWLAGCESTASRHQMRWVCDPSVTAGSRIHAATFRRRPSARKTLATVANLGFPSGD